MLPISNQYPNHDIIRIKAIFQTFKFWKPDNSVPFILKWCALLLVDILIFRADPPTPPFCQNPNSTPTRLNLNLT